MQTKIGKIYSENGFFCPLKAITEAEAKELRKDYEAAEEDLQGDLRGRGDQGKGPVLQ